jgi:nicotinate-nucleotide adenylyltransferase
VKIGLFFGSFNPVHNGHLIIANYLREITDLQQVWLVVSPQSPFKQKQSMLPEYDRLHLIQLAIADNLHLRASSIEFKLPKPSYTIDTLIHLRELHPEHEFALIMGGDNLASLPRWKNYEQILQHHHIYVYQRADAGNQALASHPHVHIMDVPMLDVSSTFIRAGIAAGRSMQYFLPDTVWEYVRDYNLFK